MRFAISIYLLIPSYTLITFCEPNIQYSLYYWKRIKNKMGTNFVLWRFVLVWQTWPANQVELYFMSHHFSWLPKVRNCFMAKKKTLKKLQRLTYSVTMEAGNFYQNFYYYLSWQLTAKKFLQWQLLILNTSEPIPFTFNLLSSLRTLISVLLFRIQSLYSYNYSSMTMKYWFILTLRF